MKKYNPNSGSSHMVAFMDESKDGEYIKLTEVLELLAELRYKNSCVTIDSDEDMAHAKGYDNALDEVNKGVTDAK